MTSNTISTSPILSASSLRRRLTFEMTSQFLEYETVEEAEQWLSRYIQSALNTEALSRQARSRTDANDNVPADLAPPNAPSLRKALLDTLIGARTHPGGLGRPQSMYRSILNHNIEPFRHPLRALACDEATFAQNNFKLFKSGWNRQMTKQNNFMAATMDLMNSLKPLTHREDLEYNGYLSISTSHHCETVYNVDGSFSGGAMERFPFPSEHAHLSAEILPPPKSRYNSDSEVDAQNFNKESGAYFFRPTWLALKKRRPDNSKSLVRNPGQAYQGDMSSNSFVHQQVDGLPDRENCATWMVNIPVQVSEQEIFDKTRSGAVLCLYINQETDFHQTKAAKLVFMTPQGAANLIGQSRAGRFWLGDKMIPVRYNRTGYKRYEHQRHSRVIIISGPRELMTLEFWNTYFEDICIFTLEFHKIVWESLSRKSMEFRFIRIDGQALPCLQAIQSDDSLKQKGVEVSFGKDPCDPKKS